MPFRLTHIVWCSRVISRRRAFRPLIQDARIQCRFSRCMHQVRLVATSIQGAKRQKLANSDLVTHETFSEMAPMLIQEVDDASSDSTQLELDQVEALLKRLLLDVAKHIDETSAATEVSGLISLPPELIQEPLVLRWTGGWVRDKLLGVPSHDIDVAINRLTGYQFGLRMKEYLEIPGNLAKYGLDAVAQDDQQSQKAGFTDKSKTVGGLHKIEANPEKSKHLETTTLRILGLDIDLVNLRKETYSDESRNPQVEFGTPQEDALRRDATVNAMFYNINTDTIEDFTLRGHKDMRERVIRTPLEPYQTFKDDPLRVMRLIRFASRLGYTVDGEVLEAMRNVEIKDALRRKISRERVGVELDKCLHGPDPHEAMRLIYSLDLYATIFSDPTVANKDHFAPDTQGWQKIIGTLQDVLDNGGVLQQYLARDKDERYLAWQLAAIVPYRNAPQTEPSEPGKKAPPPLAVTVIREGVKATKKTGDVILAAIRNQSHISTLVDDFFETIRRKNKKFDHADPAAREVIGMAIRKWGESWRSQVLYSMLVDVANEPDQIEGFERKYAMFVEHIGNLDILEVCSFKPLLDGKKLAKMTGIPPGPWMKDALDVVMAWQLRNPGATDLEQPIDEVKRQQNRNGELHQDLSRCFLKLTIRPLFMKAKSSSVTQQGRKVNTPALPKKLTMEHEDENTTKPWKASENAYCLKVLRWVMLGLDEEMIEAELGLIVPPILALLDDWETEYKKIGAQMVDILIDNASTSLVQRTGLGEVFEEALLPCLTYLPPLTPLWESNELLESALAALLTLGKNKFASNAMSLGNSTQPDGSQSHRAKYLDRIVRKGFIQLYPLCSDYPNLKQLLFAYLGHFLDLMRLDSVKHIKYILPIINDTLSHPQLGSSERLHIHALNALQHLIKNGWARMAEWRGEVLKGICLCWLEECRKYSSGDSGKSDELKRELIDTVELLGVAVADECDFKEECRVLIEADERLDAILGLCQ